MYTKQKQLVRKLDRRNAFKNVDYDASTSPSSSSSSSLSPIFDFQSAHRTQSLDILSLSDQNSYRIEGSDGDIDFICRSLGFSSPDDFAIPAADWEAHKASSITGISYFESPARIIIDDDVVRTVSPVRVRVSDDVSNIRSSDSARTTDEFGRIGSSARVRVSSDVRKIANDESVGVLQDGNCVVKSRIKGVRPPPVFARPPVIPQVIIDNGPVIRDNAVAAVVGSAAAVVTDGDTTGMVILRNDDEENTATEVEYFVSPNGSVSCSIKNWQKGDFLGSGSFGTVYEGFNEYGFFFAVKEVSLLDQGTQGKQSLFQLEQEIFLLSQFQHDNIVRYLGTDKDESKLYIFLELVPKGSLANLYQKYRLRDSQVSTYTRQILNGLTYLHGRNVVHRDIKCANILVDVSGSVKLADFGLAKATKLNDIKSCKGTPYWMAPEVVNNRKNKGYGRAADIWSLGCTVLEMLTGRVPYSHLEGMQALFRIGGGELPTIPKNLSEEAKDFILKCLQVNPNDRPTAAQLLKHPFVKMPVSVNLSPGSPLCSRIQF
ncbi:mitogen-activated protein kinase kinase kinase 1-like [Rutidosis leptorrhynchoides]|uniref:mitogen-activated protein kinase kinase kinase 1-like n=1 Tax=Rutidosis leptorrhynchoides TaxID=125765 RepID=UPI003A9A3AA0